MIEVLGMSPISSFSTTLRKNFVSLFREGVSNAYGLSSARTPGMYTSYRGYMVSKELIDPLTSKEPAPSEKVFSFKDGLYFQFNPSTIREEKLSNYNTREYPGMAYVDYVWAGGSDKTLNFELFLDNTPQTKTKHFRPESYDSVRALEIDDKTMNMNDVYFKEGKAYSSTRVSERGVLPEVEKLESFLYPALKNREAVPKFSSGGVVDNDQFRPPPTVIFTYGPMYYEGIVRSVNKEYTLFDFDLTPLRCTANVEFVVFEFQNLERLIEVRQ